jgi:hypothetical protein
MAIARVPMVSPRPVSAGIRRDPIAAVPVPLPRTDSGAVTRTARRKGHVTMVLVGLVTVTLVGLVYLTQILHAASYQYQIDTTHAEIVQLRQEIQSQRGAVARLGAEPRVIQWAQQQGLDPLGSRLRVRAR